MKSNIGALLLSLVFVVNFNSNAQVNNNKVTKDSVMKLISGKNTLHTNLSFGVVAFYLIPDFTELSIPTLGLDYSLSNNWSLGVFGSRAKGSEKSDTYIVYDPNGKILSYNTQDHADYWSYGGRAAYHIYQDEQFDFYIGAAYLSVSGKKTTETNDPSRPNKTIKTTQGKTTIGLFGGGRFKLTKRLCVLGELSLGNVFFNCGGSFKIN